VLHGLKVAAETILLSIPYAVVFINVQDYKSSKKH